MGRGGRALRAGKTCRIYMTALLPACEAASVGATVAASILVNILVPHIPSMAVVSFTSNIPQHGMGNYFLGAFAVPIHKPSETLGQFVLRLHSRLLLSIENPFCGCPYNQSPTLWGPYSDLCFLESLWKLPFLSQHVDITCFAVTACWLAPCLGLWSSINQTRDPKHRIP